MANYTVPSQHGGQIPLQTQDRDYLSALDVVWANKYEGEKISTKDAMLMEFEFYKGAPPQWLNFFQAERQNSPFVKRDIYEVLNKKINETKRERRCIAHINLFHDPGSGGSTLAMQILWDLRKKFRCAKLLDSTTDTKAIAQQVLQLFRAGGSENQNTVLLLLDKCTSEDTSFQDNLETNLWDEIKANNITTRIPVVIVLNCLRQTDLTKRSECLKLSSSLSNNEQENFMRKQLDITTRYEKNHTQLHAFNIMLRNYDPAYVTEVCTALHPLKRNKRQQLLAFLALINSYAPGSYLPYDLCQVFIDEEGNDLHSFSLKEYMQPFTDFLVIYSTKEGEDGKEDRHVRMVHPMIAHECLRLLTEAGVTRGDTTLKLLQELCRNEMPLFLVKMIKKLLTKRESRPQEPDQEDNNKDSRENFSKLIRDISTEEGSSMCIAVLKMAVKKFTTDPFYPQALARFYYIEKKDYERAKHWAEMAIKRDERNSFIRDTLGQVYKKWLKNIIQKEKSSSTNPEEHARNILSHGKKTTEVFKDVEDVAKKEEAREMQDHGMGSTSTIFNNRGMFGYMQVASIIFDDLINLNSEWSKVLTKETSPHHLLNSYGNGKFERYRSFITSLRDEVEEKFEFFEQYLLYSQPKIGKSEPDYFWPEVDKCYNKFVTQTQHNKVLLQVLKEQKVSTYAGLLSTEARDTALELIVEQWKEMHLHSPHDAQNIQNYIVANVMLNQRNDTSPALRPLGELQTMLYDLWTEQKDNRSPEFYLLVLLLFWPDAQEDRHNSLDITECVRYMDQSFERTYKHYLRARYLVPLFFLTARHGLQRFVHKSCLDKNLSFSLKTGCEIPQLLRVRGEVRNYKVFAVEGSENIEVSPYQSASLRDQGRVSFYLGFNIKGPVAYNIKYE